MILDGGSACAIHAVDVVDARGVRHPLVLKRFFRRDWLEREPDVAEREARHLQLLSGVELPVPRLVGVDPDASHCDLPSVLMTRLPGRSVVAPEEMDSWLLRLVEPLPVLHAVDGHVLSSLAPYRAYVALDDLLVPAWSSRKPAWDRAIQCVQGAAPEAVDRFVHRDYHPTNVLFTRGAVSGVLDFTDSSRGPAAVDLGHCRLNLALLHGPDVAERFLAIHKEVAPDSIELSPYWDLLSLVELLPGPPSVYWGWRNLGVTHLSEDIVRERADEYVELLVSKLG
jgi:aminoglycoside phosphotransferase (APT) family kinase protein